MRQITDIARRIVRYRTRRHPMFFALVSSQFTLGLKLTWRVPT
jgi:hypothetical protein